MNFFKLSFFLAATLFFTSLIGSCTAQLPTVDLKVGSTVFRVELATTESEREQGLMYRDAMPEKSGMLFVFAEEVPQVFWMKNTKIPLSIAFANKEGVIKTILDMTPYSLAPESSEYSVKYALEVNQGTFVRAGIHVGDKIAVETLPLLTPEPLPNR